MAEGGGGARGALAPTFTRGMLSIPKSYLSLYHANHVIVFINTLCMFITMAKRRSTESLRKLDDWQNRPVTQRISNNYTSGDVEDKDLIQVRVTLKNHAQ